MTSKKLIQKIEELSMNALPAIQTNIFDGWILRFSNGYTKRANSINPLYASSEDLHKKIKYAEKVYQNQNLRIVYKLTERVFPEELDITLEHKGYTKDGLTSVQILSLKDVVVEINEYATVYEYLHDDWFNSFCQLNHVDEKDKQTLKQMLGNIIHKTGYFYLSNDSGEILACGMCVLEREYIGIFDIVPSENYRNRGYGTKLIKSILRWGKENGAKSSYLQVVSDNVPALKLYSKLGFKEIYKYWYRLKD